MGFFLVLINKIYCFFKFTSSNSFCQVNTELVLVLNKAINTRTLSRHDDESIDKKQTELQYSTFSKQNKDKVPLLTPVISLKSVDDTAINCGRASNTVIHEVFSQLTKQSSNLKSARGHVRDK